MPQTLAGKTAAPHHPRQDSRSWTRSSRLTLARKLAAVGCVFLAVALCTVGLSMWVTWQLEGGAAAINEAGRMRMRSYQLALQVRELQAPLAGQAQHDIAQRIQELDDSLALLAKGDPQRPLSVPDSELVQRQLKAVAQGWQALRAEALQRRPLPTSQPPQAPLNIDPFVAEVDQLVSAIEQRLEARTVALHTFQVLMMVLAVLSAMAILYASHVMVLDPVARLRNAVHRVEEGDFTARVRVGANDELGELADGFNQMTARLQALYGGLEAKVKEKTQRLEGEQARLRALYEVSTFVAGQRIWPNWARALPGRCGASRTQTPWPSAGLTKPTTATCCWPATACRRCSRKKSNACSRAIASVASACSRAARRACASSPSSPKARAPRRSLARPRCRAAARSRATPPWSPCL
jgi:two-component system nitrate/nitrite sensor histidine kinase NarX